MRYRDLQPPEGINVTRTHPLKELAILLGGAILVVIVAVAVLSVFGGQLARLIPPEMETALVSDYELPVDDTTPLVRYLQALGERLADEMDMPEGLQIRVHVMDGDTVNAFATLGGHVVLFRGLLERIPHENALAFLLAHEIAHLKHRDPITALGQGAFVSIGLGLLLGSTNLGVLEGAGLLTRLKFSRDMETRADATAVAAVERVYGHSGGATALMTVLLRSAADGYRPPLLFSTHPDPQRRIDLLAKAERRRGELTPLPVEFGAWLDVLSGADRQQPGPAAD